MKNNISIALILAGALASRASAQVPAGGEFQVNTYTTGMQVWPAVAADASGNFVVAWSSDGQDGSGFGVFGQRYDASGVRRGVEFQVNTYTTGYQGGGGWMSPKRLAIASDPAGNFVVVWADFEPSRRGIFARLYDASGSPRAAEFRVDTYTGGSGYPHSPAIASDAVGNFVVAWTNPLGFLGGYDVFGQRFDASGTRLGAEFQVGANTATWQGHPAVASDGQAFVIVWLSTGAPDAGVLGQIYEASGLPRGSEFQVSTQAYNGLHRDVPAVAFNAAGDLVVAWSTWTGGPGPRSGVAARRYDASGSPRGAEIQVADNTDLFRNPSVALDAAGNFILTWATRFKDGDLFGIFARRYDASGSPLGSEFQVNTHTAGSQYLASVVSDPSGGYVVAWQGVSSLGPEVFAQRFGNLQPAGFAVDASASGSSDGNGVLEPGESVAVKPSFRNVNGLLQTVAFDGVASSFSGPSASGVSYQLQDGAARYGPIANGDTAPCHDCYQVGVTFGGVRPAVHWDATLVEDLSLDPQGQRMTRSLHLGESFRDVPKTSGYYPFVETLLHNGVTGGCGAAEFCPENPVTREQLAVFSLVGREGPSYRPYWDCSPWPFADVPATSPFCPWIAELAGRGVVSGCGGGNYCPSDPVSREQMPVFMLKTLDSNIDPPACTTPMFADVPASSPYCRWIQELARRGVVSGCGGGNYCPSDPVTREQMAVFVSLTFGLSLYGP